MCTRVAGARAARRPWSSVSSIGLSSRGGPGSRISTCAPCSTHCPGAVPLPLSSTTPSSTTSAWRRLIAGIGMPRAAKRASSLAMIAGSSIKRPADHAGDGVARHVVVGRAQAAGQDDQVGARQRVRDDAGQRVDAIADDVLGADADAEPGQAVGDRQRVGVETRRDQQLAADRHDLRRRERRQAHSHILIANRERPEQAAHDDVAPHAGEDVVAHHAESAGQPLGPSGRERLDDVADAEDQEADQPAGPRQRQEQRGDQHADHLVDHHRPGIDAAEMGLGGVGRPDAGDEQQHQRGALGPPRPDLPQAERQRHTGNRAERAGSERDEADARDGRDEHGQGQRATRRRAAGARAAVDRHVHSGRVSSAARPARTTSVPASRS